MYINTLLVWAQSRKLLLFTLIALMILPISGLRGQSPVNFIKSKLIIESNLKNYEFNVDVALSPSQQSRGLMFRLKLDSNAGMLFFHQREKVASMWMNNTYIPLDMLFIAADGRIVNIVQRTVPGSLETISSIERAIAVLEINGGTTSRLKIQKGDRVKHPAFLINKD